MTIEWNGFVALSCGDFKHGDPIAVSVYLNVTPQLNRIDWICFNGEHPRASFRRQQSVDSDVGPDVKHRATGPNRGTEYFSCFLFIELRIVPETESGLVPQIHIKCEIAIEIRDSHRKICRQILRCESRISIAIS